MSRHFDWAFLKHGSKVLLATWELHLTTLHCKSCHYVAEITNVWVWASQFTFSFSPSLLMGSKQPVSFSPFFFRFYACWSLCMWSTSGFFTVYKHLPVLSPSYFLGKPLHTYLKVPLVALNSGTQPLSCSIMVPYFDHLPQPHPRSSAWVPDEASLPWPALVIVVCNCMWPIWEQSCLLVMFS